MIRVLDACRPHPRFFSLVKNLTFSTNVLRFRIAVPTSSEYFTLRGCIYSYSIFHLTGNQGILQGKNSSLTVNQWYKASVASAGTACWKLARFACAQYYGVYQLEEKKPEHGAKWFRHQQS